MNRAMNASVVVLSEDEAAMQLIARAVAHTSVRRYATVQEMIREQPLSSIAVLIIDTQPSGALLATLGRMSVEYPAMQKIAVMDEPPPLPVANYLTACAVDLVWRQAGEDSTDKLAAVVDRSCERAKWLVN